MTISDHFRLRREKVMNELGEGVLILSSYPERLLSNDTNYKYRPHSDLIYFTGFPEPNTIAIIENKGKEIIYNLYVPKRDPEYETWNGRRYGIDGALKHFLADKAFAIDTTEEELPKILMKYETIFFSENINLEQNEIIAKAISRARSDRDRPHRGPVTITDPIDVIHKHRCQKSPEEIRILRKVAKISADAITYAMKVTKPGIHESQIEAIIEYGFRKNGCERPAYPTICGSGINATILHYLENSSEMKDGNLLLVDAGGELDYYCADISRTWPINGKFSSSQKEIYQFVLDIQKSSIEMVKPGVTIGEIQKVAIERLTSGLIQFGLLAGDLATNIEEKTYRRFFMHGLGHWLGLDVHDTGRVNRDKEPLKEGYYFTVEPGIYIPDEDDVPQQYRGIGVRIEDDILVTNDGYEILTSDVVKEISDIEKIVGTVDLP
ncbi:MAG: aminopeptidase P N-terminal domain-containing protein [Candidatus Kariarchaeaceae archaeon]